MSILTTSQELTAVRTAIQTLTTSTQAVASVNLGGMSISYDRSQLPWLENREKELMRRMTVRNVRKRVTPDFS